MSEASGWTLMVILIMLIGWNVWLDLRVQKLEDIMWNYVVRHLEDGLVEDLDDA